MGFVFVVIFLRYFLGIMNDLQEVEKIQKSPRWEIKFDLISWQCKNSFPQSFHLTGQNFSLFPSYQHSWVFQWLQIHFSRPMILGQGEKWPCRLLHPMLLLLLWLMGVQRPLANGMFCLFIKFHQCQFLKECLGLRAALNPEAGIWQTS